MEKVDLGPKRAMIEMVELRGHRVMAPKDEAEEWQRNFDIMKEWVDVGVSHRLNTIGDKEAQQILVWLWAEGVSSVIQRMTAKDVSSVQFIIGPQCFHKFNIGRGWWDWVARPGKLSDDPEIQDKKAAGVPSAEPEIFEPDVFVQWSGDVHYPYSFAHLPTAAQVCAAFTEGAEMGHVYAVDIQNFFYFAREDYPRIGLLLGITGLNIPGRMVKEKHRYVHEKPNLVPDPWTPAEHELIAKTEQISALEKLGWQDYYRQLLTDLKAGKKKDRELKPGVRSWYANEITHEPTLRRNLEWWDHHPMDENGVLHGFGEFEAREHEERMAALGYKRSEQ